jgi:hypothetical protein
MNDIVSLVLGLSTIFVTFVVGVLFLHIMNIFAKKIDADGKNDVDQQ